MSAGDGDVVIAARFAGRKRELVASAILLAGVLAVLITTLTVGSYSISLPNLFVTLVGNGEPGDTFIVWQLRLPRLVIGIIAGTAFALAGAIFQSMLGNPLASPDVIGVTQGASLAAVFALLGLGLSGLAVSAFAFAGALAVAAIIYFLSWRSGITGSRFVLIGIAIAFLVQGAIGYFLTRADVRDAQDALVWLVGGLGGARWADVAVAGAGLLILLPLTWLVASRLRILQLGTDAATGLGLATERSRLALIVVAVALAALATAAVGPIAFVAFVSAPVARRAIHNGGLNLVPSALVGVLLVLTADFVAHTLLPGDVQVPAGILTGIVGAPYLLWLLARGIPGAASRA